MKKIILILFAGSMIVGCSNSSKYDLAIDKEAVKVKKELTAFEHKRAQKELSDWQ